MSLYLPIDNRKKDILILDKGRTRRLRDTALTVEVKYSITLPNKKQNCLILQYNGRNSYLFVNGVKIYQFKAK